MSLDQGRRGASFVYLAFAAVRCLPEADDNNCGQDKNGGTDRCDTHFFRIAQWCCTISDTLRLSHLRGFQCSLRAVPGLGEVTPVTCAASNLLMKNAKMADH